MQLGNKTFIPFIPEQDIVKRVKELAQTISEDYKGKDPIFLIILNGAFLFASDLVKEVKVPCQLSFIKVASYTGTQSRGETDMLIGLSENLNNRHIILLDDIIDTGLTMANVLEEVKKKNPSSVAVASLLLKPDSFQQQFEANYIGFSIPHDFVVGYGLDYDGYGRNLKTIYKLQN